MAVAAQPDATSVALVGTDDPALAGSVLFSPSTADVVVVATGMTEPAANQAYMCWLDTGSGRVRIGKMFFGGDLAYWAGRVRRDRRAGRPGDVRGLARGGRVALDRCGAGVDRPVLIVDPPIGGIGTGVGELRVGIVRWRATEVGSMQLQQAKRGRGRHVDAFRPEFGRQPQRLARGFVRIDVRLASSRVEDDEPDQPGSDHEPDDEQPPIELGIHRREV